MRKLTTLLLAIGILSVIESRVAGQTGGTPSANLISNGIRMAWDAAKQNIRESADLMSDANYSFKPAEGVRTFGQVIAHLAGANYVFCAPAKGEKSPYGEDHFEKTAKTKAEIVKAINDSIAYCDSAYAALTDATASESIDMPFFGSVARATTLTLNTGHNQEHYGNLVTYFRIKGIVPPSTAREQKKPS